MDLAVCLGIYFRECTDGWLYGTYKGVFVHVMWLFIVWLTREGAWPY